MRLERLFNVTLKSLKLFQCHKGAIRTSQSNVSRNAFDVFQFHKGAIRTGQLNGNIYRSARFQFHKGAIRTNPECFASVGFAISIQ